MRVTGADEADPLVKAQIRKGVSIIKPEWILESIKRKKPLPLLKE
jgi:DNA ligase-4